MTEIDINKLVYILPKSELNKCLLDDSETNNKCLLDDSKSDLNSHPDLNSYLDMNLNISIKCELLDNLISDLDVKWQQIIKSSKEYPELNRKLEYELNKPNAESLILPNKSLFFNAFKLCSFPPKVIILGQDPYYANTNEAMGLSFSVPDGVPIPPTLTNIFKEISTDINNSNIPKSGNLTKWAEQGVLLLNSSLSVIHKKKESHMNLWNKIIIDILTNIYIESETPIVFLVWGNYAKKKLEIVQKNITSKLNFHLVLEASHPSPLGVISKGWFGCKHFSKCNKFLKEHNIEEIDWVGDTRSSNHHA
jgi:uracil-DNA glycosylase